MLLLLAVGTVGTALRAQEISWQEAVVRLARERTMAETCVALLKQYGDQASQARGSITYGEAKAEYDGVIAGLVVALTRKGRPESLPDLQDRPQRGFDKREAFCRSVEPLMPKGHVEKGPIAALAHYVARHVASLTGGKQTPDMEVRFDTTVFAVGL